MYSTGLFQTDIGVSGYGIELLVQLNQFVLCRMFDEIPDNERRGSSDFFIYGIHSFLFRMLKAI